MNKQLKASTMERRTVAQRLASLAPAELPKEEPATKMVEQKQQKQVRRPATSAVAA